MPYSFTLRRWLAAFAIGCTLPAAAQEGPRDDGLFQAWGGKPGIESVVQDFVGRLKDDPRIGHFFAKTDLDNLRTQLASQFCQVAGGPCRYEGAAMGPVHEGLNIRKADFHALVEVLQQSMQARGIPFAAQNGMLARLAPMHRDIIEKD